MTGPLRKAPRPAHAPSSVPAVPWAALVRGPLGAGKTTVCRSLAVRTGAAVISIDRILDDHGLEEWSDGYISEASFLRANSIAIEEAHPILARGRPVVIDGNFYWRSVVLDLESRLSVPLRVFTLTLPLELCIERDAHRQPSFGADAAGDVYRKSTGFDCGTPLDATESPDRIVSRILDSMVRGERSSVSADRHPTTHDGRTRRRGG
ncbi:MAG: ATP-binding protein [Thermoplasmata archaeon]|nr:ATP-binding protein [Thermoplasmata archaeon]